MDGEVTKCHDTGKNDSECCKEYGKKLRIPMKKDGTVKLRSDVSKNRTLKKLVDTGADTSVLDENKIKLASAEKSADTLYAVDGSEMTTRGKSTADIDVN